MRLFQTTSTTLLVLCAGCAFAFALSAQAASFDCGKASTKVEHMICDNAEISKLDDELNTAYKAAVQDKQWADTIKQAQKRWLKERNGCVDAGCVRQAYEVRRSSFAFGPLPKGAVAGAQASSVQTSAGQQTRPREADKKETVKRIMAKVEIKHFASEFCEEFLADFRRMENIEFIEPIERAEKFDDPIWDSYKARCPNMGLFETYECEPRIAMYLDELPKNEQDEKMKVSCRQFRCTENFKHFRLSLKGDGGNRTDDIFYCEREHGPLNREGARQFDSSHGYSIRDTKQCQGMGAASTKDSYSYTFQHPLDNVNGLVVYKGKHYIFDLREIDKAARTPEKAAYELEVWGHDRRGDEKQIRLYQSCLFTTAAPGQ